MPRELLLGADAVDRQLQCPASLRRPAEFVVDEAEGPILEQIETIGLSAQGDRPGTVGRRKGEVARQLLLQQALDHGNRAFGFHPKHRVAEAGGGGRSEQPCALETRLGIRKRFERAVHHRGEHAAGLLEIPGRHGAPARPLPRGEELLEHLVDELTLTTRIHDLFVVGLLLELEDVLREKLERTIEIRFDRADRPRARRKGADGTVEVGRIRGRPRGPQLRPAPRVSLKRIEDRRLERQCFVREDPGVLEWLARDRRQPGARNLVELQRTRHDGVVVEREGGHRRPASRRRQQVEEPRVGGGAPILLGRPAERLEQRRRIENVAPRPLGPVLVDHADNRHIVEIAVAGGLIVEQVHGAAVVGVGDERLILDPAPHGNAQFVDGPVGIAVCGVHCRQRRQHVDDRRTCAPLARCERIVVGNRAGICGPERDKAGDLLGGRMRLGQRREGAGDRERRTHRGTRGAGAPLPRQGFQPLELAQIPGRAQRAIERADRFPRQLVRLVLVRSKHEVRRAQERNHRGA